MHRHFVASAGGETFFEKYRKGFKCVLTEISKLEHITEDLGKPLEISYFSPDIELLENANPIHVSTILLEFCVLKSVSKQEDALQLYTAVSEQPINLDTIEERLQNIREKLLKLEENPILLKKGYKPYIPPDSLMEALEPEPDHEGVIAELSFSSPTNGNGVNENIPHDQVTPLSTPRIKKSVSIDPNTPKCASESNGTSANHSKPIDSEIQSSRPTTTILPRKESPVISDPKLANCLNILKRWNTVGVEDTKSIVLPESVARNSTLVMRGELPKHVPPLLTTSAKKIATISPVESVTSSVHQPLKPVSKFKPSVSINRSKTFTMEAKPKQFGSNSAIEYETVEFTPGMTSKVRK